jgi:hypothetical protein
VGITVLFVAVLLAVLYAGLMALLAWFGPARYLELDRNLLPVWLRISMDALSDETVSRRARTTYLIYTLLLLSAALCIALTILGPAIGAFLRRGY